jgi:peptidyl-prolyl cis-trans isomerase A (cyclophilin A)
MGCGGAEGAGDGADSRGRLEETPEPFGVEFVTSAGTFEVEFVPEWSPIAVERVRELVGIGFWQGARFYRVNDSYAQFGYSGRPELDAEWIEAGLPDEPSKASNVRGAVSFARAGPGSRGAILFINRVDNTQLDELDWRGVRGFPPVGRVVRGMDVVDALHDGYGEETMEWEDSIATVGNDFLDRAYPALDSIVSVHVLPDGG